MTVTHLCCPPRRQCLRTPTVPASPPRPCSSRSRTLGSRWPPTTWTAWTGWTERMGGSMGASSPPTPTTSSTGMMWMSRRSMCPYIRLCVAHCVGKCLLSMVFFLSANVSRTRGFGGGSEKGWSQSMINYIIPGIMWMSQRSMCRYIRLCVAHCVGKCLLSLVFFLSANVSRTRGFA